MYIPPNLTSNDFECLFEAVELLIIDKPVLIIGDFNIPHFNNTTISSAINQIFQSFCKSLRLKQFNNVHNIDYRRLRLILTNNNSNTEKNQDQLTTSSSGGSLLSCPVH